ncbi:TonB-dependent receptor domain-containing protein [Owenweeksia hongkongensis]|uniref:TonB-dependent receptor n=1 Tax=Owenweeksia hongkongensis TaxID=253245 RepID=UPI003A94E050
MNHTIKTLVIMLALAMPLVSFSQKGIIRGQVIDGETGEPLFSANAVLKGTMTGATTDFDGKFELSAEEGTYNLEVTFIGMASVNITDLKVKSGDVTVVEAIALKPASNELGEVVITAEVARNTQAAMMTLKKKSTNVIDGISAGELKKTGDSDAGDAAKRVTGVSVEGGKYVYVRGIGDRYTKTMLNGVDVPGLDPDRNAIQIDIFPTNLIDNMTILKSGLAELPADFTGGLVDIVTKDFPDRPVFDVSVGLGYNPAMHFNSDYITYDGGKTDFLGFDDGTRALPEGADDNPIPSPFSRSTYSDQEINDFIGSFNPTLGAMKQRSFMDYDLGVSAGNQKMLENGNKLGYIFSLTYKNSTDYYDEVEYGEYVLPTQGNDNPEMLYTNKRNGSKGSNNVLLGGMAGLAYKTQNAKYQFTVMHLQNGETEAAQMHVDNSENGNATGQSGYQAYQNSLVYSERALTNVLLSGEHHLKDDKWEVNWRISPTLSRMDEPDLRKTSFSINRGDSTFEAGQGGNPRRSWRDLSEINTVAQLNLIRKHKMFDRDAKLKFGGSYVYKNRSYEILTFDLQSYLNWPEFTGDPNAVLTPENIYPNGSQMWYNPSQEEVNANEYTSTAHNTAFYVSEEVSLSMRLKAIVGLRAEYFVQYHTGRDQAGANGAQGGNVLDNEKVLDALDLFPSANLIFAKDENENIRFSYFRSIARPSFKELSFAQIQDPITDRIFNGGFYEYTDGGTGEVLWNGDLTETRINNFDLRWEMFMKPGEVFSISGFAKFFDNAIELVRIPTAQTTSEFQPRNVGNGQLFGAEIEFRKNLGFISPVFDKYSFSGNFTYAYSQIDMSNVEEEGRKAYAREGQEITGKRPMAGQAPYIVNAGLSYDNLDKKFNAGVFYNVKGRTLEVVGGRVFPDVYTEMFHSLNFTARKAFGKDSRSAVTFKVKNILNDVQESFYVGYEAQDQIFSRLSPGVQFSLGYTYKFK